MKDLLLGAIIAAVIAGIGGYVVGQAGLDSAVEQARFDNARTHAAELALVRVELTQALEKVAADSYSYLVSKIWYTPAGRRQVQTLIKRPGALPAIAEKDIVVQCIEEGCWGINDKPLPEPSE